MENNSLTQPQSQPQSLPQPQSHAFFRRPWNAPVCFILALALFALPFAEFKCANVSLLGNSGIGIALGRDWKMAAGMGSNELFKDLEKDPDKRKELFKNEPNIFALVAIAAGLFGILLLFLKGSWRSLAGMSAGILGALMLIAVMFQLNWELRALMKAKPGEEGTGLAVQGLIKIQFTIWYFISLVSFLAAAFFHYMQGRIALRDAMERAVMFEFQEKPPGESTV